VQPQPAPGACQYRTAANGQTLPDPNCTPGAISPKVTQDTLATTICRTGYTKSIRPPASITEVEKRENAAAYGYTGSLKDVEYDHLFYPPGAVLPPIRHCDELPCGAGLSENRLELRRVHVLA
jgi:hypothetical protein